MSKSTAVTVAMLPKLTLASEPHPFLYCTKCGAEYSANAGDYWNSPDDHKFRCCRRNMVLVVRETRLRDYRDD